MARKKKERINTEWKKNRRIGKKSQLGKAGNCKEDIGRKGEDNCRKRDGKSGE